MDTNFEHYKVFYYVAKYENLTKAASVLKTSQPAVTRTIHNLENILGCRLFIRSKTGMKLTPEGNIFYEYVAAGCAQFFKGENNLSNLISLVGGVWSPTADLATEIGWGAIAFVLITKHKIKANGLGGYLLGYFKPLPPLMPINVISEVMTPLSMAFRHFGNVASGSIISMLVYSALGAASAALFGLIPGVVGQVMSGVPLLQIGLPAILSIYFDLFSSCIQAFIFCMLMMINISVAAEG